MHMEQLQKMMAIRRNSLKFKAFRLLLELCAMSAFFTAVYVIAFGWDLNDSFYFIIVTSTTVGYGDVLPETNAEKIVTIFTMLTSTVVMGKILGDAVNLYVVDILEERIKNKIINSATYVHHCDLQGDGTINEAEYSLFKLLQLQKIERAYLIPIAEKFKELDEDGSGLLEVGKEVPAPYGWVPPIPTTCTTNRVDERQKRKKVSEISSDAINERVHVGARVEARHGGGTEFYPGVVVRKNDSDEMNPTFDINYDDGDKEKCVDLEHIYEPPRRGELTVGREVEARHAGGNEFFPGVIAKINPDDTYAIDYDDGDKEEHVVLRHIFACPFDDVTEQHHLIQKPNRWPVKKIKTATMVLSAQRPAANLNVKFEVERLNTVVKDLETQLKSAQEENARWRRIEYITNVRRIDPLTKYR